MGHNNLSWWGNNTWNWGDQLNPWLYSKITGIPVSKINRIELWDKSNTPRYYVIGSILNHTHSPNVEVWGSGLEGGNYPIPHLPSKLNAVRGPLTRKVEMAMSSDNSSSNQQTISLGEIEIKATVNVSFILN